MKWYPAKSVVEAAREIADGANVPLNVALSVVWCGILTRADIRAYGEFKLLQVAGVGPVYARMILKWASAS